jgi:hypothetical protein
VDIILAGGLRHARLREMGAEHLLNTGAKLYPRGAGWYLISGYASDGQDVVDALIQIRAGAGARYIAGANFRYALDRDIISGSAPGRDIFSRSRAGAGAALVSVCTSCRHYTPVESLVEWEIRQQFTGSFAG